MGTSELPKEVVVEYMESLAGVYTEDVSINPEYDAGLHLRCEKTYVVHVLIINPTVLRSISSQLQ